MFSRIWLNDEIVNSMKKIKLQEKKICIYLKLLLSLETFLLKDYWIYMYSDYFYTDKLRKKDPLGVGR